MGIIIRICQFFDLRDKDPYDVEPVTFTTLDVVAGVASVIFMILACFYPS